MRHLIAEVPSYEPPLFRPPSEADSLIFQVTHGCSGDTCAFCRMYVGKPFRKRPEGEVLEEFEAASRIYPRARRVFLADGDPFALTPRVLVLYARRLRALFPRLERIATYASPVNILRRGAADLRRVREAGISLLYIGVESGSAEVLARVAKGATPDEIVEACLGVKEAGFRTSVTVILGLGGPELSRVHAEETGRVLTAGRPDYIGALTLMLHEGNADFDRRFGRPWRTLTTAETLEEEKILLENIRCDGCEFRSNHASNWLALKGRLQEDRGRLLGEIEEALGDPRGGRLRPDWARGL